MDKSGLPLVFDARVGVAVKVVVADEGWIVEVAFEAVAGAEGEAVAVAAGALPQAARKRAAATANATRLRKGWLS